MIQTNFLPVIILSGCFFSRQLSDGLIEIVKNDMSEHRKGQSRVVP